MGYKIGLYLVCKAQQINVLKLSATGMMTEHVLYLSAINFTATLRPVLPKHPRKHAPVLVLTKTTSRKSFSSIICR